jgi:hypothetical protein
MSAPSTSAVQPAPKSFVTLRTLLDQRKSKGERFRLSEVVSIVVPICTDLAQRHARGESVFVHAGSIGAGPDGVPRLIPDRARTRPSDPRDAAAIAPELARSAPTPRSSVFALGAIVYEMITLKSVGPGMKPPSTMVQGIPAIVDQILAKALVTDPAQRPEDLPAFAQAIHHFAPTSVAPPPIADEAAFEVDIDLRTSMLPPAGMNVPKVDIPADPLAPVSAASSPRISAPSQDPFAAVDVRSSQPETDPQRISANRAVEELAQLKARLESDPSPRWIIVKDKMDHGPFAGIELLQQIASDRFTGDDILVDTHSNSRIPIKDHKEFSRFAHHANLKREHVKEEKEVAKAEKVERAAGAAKGTIGIIAFVAVCAIVGVVVWRIQAKKAEEEARKRDEAMQVAGEGSIKGQTVAQKPKAGVGGGGGGYYNGKSYDEALNNSVSGNDDEGISMAECSAVGGGVAGGCGLNGSATAKFVVQAGRVKGVSVSTNPSQPGVEACMKAAIGGMSFRNMPAATGCIRTFKVQ